jgi:hypothetical protein
LSVALFASRLLRVDAGVESDAPGVVLLVVFSVLPAEVLESGAGDVLVPASRPAARIRARSAAVPVVDESVAPGLVVLVADESRVVPVVVVRSPVTLVLVAFRSLIRVFEPRSIEVPLTVVLVRVISAGSRPKCV